MKGEKEFFRKRFFGGFNREDVIKYIAKIAEERNEAITAKEKAETDARALADEVKKLREEIENNSCEKAEAEPLIEDELIAEEETAAIEETIDEEKIAETEEPTEPIEEPTEPIEEATYEPIEQNEKESAVESNEPEEPIEEPVQQMEEDVQKHIKTRITIKRRR